MKNTAKMKSRLYLIGASAGIVMAVGCSKDDNPLNDGCGNTAWSQKVSKEITAFSNAAVAYSDDPTSSNCLSYKAAAEGYLNALENVRLCVPTVSKAEFQQSIDEAKQEINALTCD